MNLPKPALIDRLPVNILSNVLIEATAKSNFPFNNDRVHRILLVSRYWGEIAFYTPSLWSKIDLQNIWDYEQHGWRWLLNRRRWRNYLARSGVGRNLVVRLTSDYRVHLAPISDILLSIAPRCEEFYIERAPDGNSSDALKFILSATQLNYLYLHPDDDYHTVSLPNPIVLERLTEITFDTHDLTDPNSPIWIFPRLRRLNLYDCKVTPKWWTTLYCSDMGNSLRDLILMNVTWVDEEEGV